MAIKYKETLKNLFEEEKELFQEFKKIHDNYIKNNKQFEKDFNKLGSEVLKKLKHHEDVLCAQTERGRYNKFSSQLSEKYWAEVKKHFSAIDSVKATYKIESVNIDDLF